MKLSYFVGVFMRLRPTNSEEEYQTGINYFYPDLRGSRYEITLFINEKQEMFKLEVVFVFYSSTFIGYKLKNPKRKYENFCLCIPLNCR